MGGVCVYVCVRQRKRVCSGSGGVFYSGDGLTGEGGDLAPTLEEVIGKLS